MSRLPEELIRLAISLAVNVPGPDLPIAAVIVDSSGALLSQSRNMVVASDDSTAHAEILAIQGLPSFRERDRMGHLTLAVTLEPCPMCAWAIRTAGIGTVVYGAYNDQYGACGSVYDLLRDTRCGKSIEVISGVLATECSLILSTAFSKLRNNKRR